MGRLQNDGRGRLGGRAKGTKNRPKQPLNEWLTNTLTKHKGQIDAFLASENPNERQTRAEMLTTLTLAAALMGATAEDLVENPAAEQ